MNYRIEPVWTHWCVGIVFMVLGVLALSAVLIIPETFAQESSTVAADATPGDVKPADAAPTPAVAAPTETAPKEMASTAAAPKAAAPLEAITLANSWPDITGLAMQPVYIAVKLALAVVGGIASGVAWAATGGKTDEAKRVWDATVPQPWGWPDFVRKLGKPAERAP